MTENNLDLIRERYLTICNHLLPDTPEGMIMRVQIIEWLEQQTHNAFKNTADFFEKMDKYLLRGENDGERLKMARKKKGWAQEILAAHLGISKGFVYQMEANRRPLITKALRFIATQDDERPAQP